MIEISQIKLPCGTPAEALERKIRKALRLKETSFSWEISRHSVDARKKPVLYDVYSVLVRLEQGMKPGSGTVKESTATVPKREAQLVRKLRDGKIRFVEVTEYQFPRPGTDSKPLQHPPVVIGSGPAGLFCALTLAEHGYRPLVLERGRAMEERIRDVERYWETGTLHPSSNIQFGEGGAGTFSDGKLTTNVKDRCGRNAQVLKQFVEAGAPEDILYEFHPHIGTDYLRTVIVKLRNRLQALGGEVRFSTCVTRLGIEEGRINGVWMREDAAETERFLPAEVVVLAPGHSARDTIRSLYAQGIALTQKRFAVGFRVSHPQAMVDERQYGLFEKEDMERLQLPASSYKLTAQLPSGRGIYSFCMCPGGYVVNASSEPGRLAVNGMSDYARDSARANSAIIVTVGPEEFGAEDPLAGLHFQEQLEEKAFHLAEGRIPVETYPAFAQSVRGEENGDPVPGTALTQEEEEAFCLKGQSAWASLHQLLPPDMTADFIEGMERFDRTIPGFAGAEALVAGLESRTSSPVRILRGENLESVSLKGLYPCGEGAGYAGGIMSAAIDGLKVAEAVGCAWQPFENCTAL